MDYQWNSSRILLTCIAVLALTACKKYSDTAGNHDDPRFARIYCNVPEAVNYNWNFPGTPSVSDADCIYPTDIFKGTFLYSDSIYSEANVFIREESKTLTIQAGNHTNLIINGFCLSASLPFTANRNLRADADSTFATGQLLCRSLDTLSGYIYRTLDDSTHIQFSLRIGSDTGVFYHRGTALKQ